MLIPLDRKVYFYSLGSFVFRMFVPSGYDINSFQSIGRFETAISENYDATFTLYLEESLPSTASSSGWFRTSENNIHSISCLDEKNSLFLLRYRDDDFSNIEIHADIAYRKGIWLGLQHAIMLSLSKKCVGLHGVTVICGSNALILSAPSGTGKTTLAKLLQKHCEAAIINGDFALLSYDPNDGVIFEPTPFCGTSNVCHNYRLPISNIIFLEQADESTVSILSVQEKIRYLLSNIFVPDWDEKLRNSIEYLALNILERVQICKFSFPPTREAAEMLFKYINS